VTFRPCAGSDACVRSAPPPVPNGESQSGDSAAGCLVRAPSPSPSRCSSGGLRPSSPPPATTARRQSCRWAPCIASPVPPARNCRACPGRRSGARQR
jgi:hypothetical protein